MKSLGRAARRIAGGLTTVLATALFLAPGAQAAHDLDTGFYDPAFAAGSTGDQSDRLDATRALGGNTVRVFVRWNVVAPALRPTGFRASDPSAPGYHWSDVDEAIRAAGARGLRVIFSMTGAPAWAEGAGRPRGAAPGSWRPSPSALGDFATAAARRYGGNYPDPEHPGLLLPRVSRWQVWNEPNLDIHLSPQWVRRGGSFRLASPTIYRAMLNAAYTGLKRVHRSNLVVAAGTAPYGDPAGGARVRPVRFWRALLCLQGRSLKATRCPHPAKLDAAAHHPYGIRGPGSHAWNADDAAIPDVKRIVRVVRTAVRKGRVLPRRHKRFWVTEISWDSRPPDPHGVSAAKHARWLEEGFYLLWRQGVDTITWFQVRDQLKGPSYATSYQSGVLFANGRPKPAARAFRLPFVAVRRGGVTRAWGRSPVSGRLSIERRVGGRWLRVKTIRAHRGGVFWAPVSLRRGATARARIGADASLPWRIR